MDKLGVGIIGCGNISTAYLRLAPMFRALQVRAVADIDMDAAQARAAEFGVAARSVDDLLADDGIDVVVNLTIPKAHFPVSKRVLEAGKHVYSEKPLVLTADQGAELAALAAARDLRVGSAPDTFLGGSHQMARARIDDGLLGEIVAGTAFVMNHGMEHWHPNPDFFYQPGAGPVLDIGPYYVTNLIQLLGPVKRVTALATTPSGTRTILTEGPRRGEEIPVDTPTNIQALLDFANGAAITLSASWDVWAHRHSPMELYGTEGSMFLPDPNFFGGTLEFAGRDGRIAPLALWDHPFSRPNHQHRTDGALANYRTAGLADMATAIAEGRPHRCSLELALHAVEVMTAILQAGEAGRWIDLRTTCDRPAALNPDDAAALIAPA